MSMKCVGRHNTFKSNSFEQVNFNNLPNQFVIKATHTSSHNLIVTDKKKVNTNAALKLFKKSLGKNQYYMELTLLIVQLGFNWG